MTPGDAASEAPDVETPWRHTRREIAMRWMAAGAAAVFVALVTLVAIMRYAPLTNVGRGVLTAQLDGLRLGPLGRLHVDGLTGDIWGDFRLRRLTVVDSQGAWLDARDVAISWRPAELIARKVHIKSLSAASVQIIRRPALSPNIAGSTSHGLPVSIVLDRLQMRLETLPAFSASRGLFDVGANIDVERQGGLGGAIDATSLVHPGDGLDARFDLGLHKELMLRANAQEARGGALAGSLGLAANREFQLIAAADGAPNNGRLQLNALTDGRSFASANGAWSSAGGSLTGRLSLAASRLTQPLIHSLGPEVRLTAQSRAAAGGLQQIAVQAVADNARITAQGLVDAKATRAPNGLALAVAVKDMTRIVQAPSMGAFSAGGLFTLQPKGWRWAGSARLTRLSANGYALAETSGPIQIESAAQELRVRADLQGAGGQGTGALAQAVGVKPHASLDASRLADGRILVRSVKLNGAGLVLDASGQRGLFGGLSFKGDLKLADLGVIHSGAHGGLQADWSAAQPKAKQPWSLTLDAKGDKLTSGMAQLDHLLGPAPHLTAQVRYDNGAVALTKADLTGAAVQADASGVIAKDGGLKLALTWSADGPFELGPLQVAGKANGTGTVGGVISSPSVDVVADFARIDLLGDTLHPAHVVASYASGKAATAQIALTAADDYGPVHAKANLRLLSDGMAVDGLDIAAGGVVAAGSLALRGAEPSSANLTLSAGPGVLLSAGHIDAKLAVVDAPQSASPTAALDLTAVNATPRGATIVLSSAHLSASGPLSKLPYSLAATGVSDMAPFSLKGSGEATEQPGGAGTAHAISFAGSGRVRSADFRTLSPALISLDGPDAGLHVSLGYGGGTADVDVKQIAGAFSGKATLAGVDLAALGEDAAGRVSGDLSLSGQGARLDGTMNAHLQGVRSGDAPAKAALNGDIKTVLSGGRLTLDANLAGTQAGDKASLTLSLPVQASAAPFSFAVERNAPISGAFTANTELEPLWDLFLGGDQTLGGRLTGQGRIEGTLADPHPSGHAILTGGHFEDAATGLKLRNLGADVDLHDNVVRVDKFAGQDAKSGTLAGEGSLSLAAGGSSNLTLTAKSFQLLDSDAAKATASGTLTVVRGGDGKATLTGGLTIDHAEISPVSARAPPGVTSMPVTEINGSAGRAAPQVAVSPLSAAVGLDITLRAARGIIVKGLGLNAEMSLNAAVSGTTAAPVLSGSAHIVRGDYDLAGKRFEIDDQSVVYLDAALDKIRLNLTAKLDDPTITAMINIGGTAAKPEITLTSVPALPSDEVLSEVLFGSSAAQLNPIQAAQLAAAVTSLATGGGFDVIGGLKNFAKLDRLALGGGDAATGYTISGGKYIGNNVYLQLTGGGRQGPSAQVEVRANRSLSFISEVGGDVGAKLSVRWRVDYGKAKAVKGK